MKNPCINTPFFPPYDRKNIHHLFFHFSFSKAKTRSLLTP